MLFPPHKDVLFLSYVVDGHRTSTRVFLKGAKGVELGPVAKVHLMVSTPILVLSKEVVLRADDFALEVGCERRVVFGQAYGSNVSFAQPTSLASWVD